jgi:hypothetical protein
MTGAIIIGAAVAGARLNRLPNPLRRNPHSARGTGVPHDSRVPSLDAFGRRPRCSPNRHDGPASETLHNTGQECYGRSADWWPIRHIDRALTQSLTAVASNTDRRPLPTRPLRDFDLFGKPGRVS